MTHKPDVNWDGYLLEFSPELADAICRYVTYRSRSWREEDCIHHTRSLLSVLSIFFRSVKLTCIQGITPRVWFAYVEARMKAGVQPSSLNTTLRNIQSFLRYLKNDHAPICETMLEVRPLKTGESLPRDLTVSQVKTLLQSTSTPMDRA